MYDIKPDPFIEGTIVCDNCCARIKWRYNIPKKEFGMYIGEYTDDIAFASQCDDKNNKYRVKCKNCDKVNCFEYNIE